MSERANDRNRLPLAISLAAAVLVGVSLLLHSPTHGQASAARFELKGKASKGAKNYKRLCSACHGKKGNGKGVVAVSLNPRPKDFTDAKRMRKLSDQQIYKAIRDGGQAIGKSPVMVAWKSVLSDQEIRDVAAYVRKFAKRK